MENLPAKQHQMQRNTSGADGHSELKPDELEVLVKTQSSDPFGFTASRVDVSRRRSTSDGHSLTALSNDQACDLPHSAITHVHWTAIHDGGRFNRLVELMTGVEVRSAPSNPRAASRRQDTA